MVDRVEQVRATHWSNRHPIDQERTQACCRLEPLLRHRAFGLTLAHRWNVPAIPQSWPGSHPTALTTTWSNGTTARGRGRTTPDIRVELGDPNWVIWDHPIPPGKTPGETTDEVALRCHRVIERCVPVLDAGRDCALIAHGHVLRILTATWLGLHSDAGRLFMLEAGALSSLGFERTQHVITGWNQTPE